MQSFVSKGISVGTEKMCRSICSPMDCTLCMACSNACPVDAIQIIADENGFEKVVINESKCIRCGLCEKVCTERKRINRYFPIATYAGQAKDLEALSKSASGGAFQMLAQVILEQGGICYGCTSGRRNGKFFAEHIRIDMIEQLPMILNSKYIPSIIGNSLVNTKRDLDAGKLVLFSGTPCQIQGLRAFLRKEYKNLITVDLVCHGMGAAKLFNDHIACVEKAENITVTEYLFRDKRISWGTNYCYSYFRNTDFHKRLHTRHCPREASSYKMHYLRGNFLRENCFFCSHSCINRVSDFTFGDYWQIECENPELVLRSRPRLSLKHGISCILVNTEKAAQYIPALQEKMVLYKVRLDSVTAGNGNLNKPSGKGRAREQVLECYRKYGYQAIEDDYLKSVGNKMMIYRIKNILKPYLPDAVRIWIYQSEILRKFVFHQ